MFFTLELRASHGGDQRKGRSYQQPRLDSDELVKAHSRRVASIDNSFSGQPMLKKIETHWGLCSTMLANKTQQKELPSAHLIPPQLFRVFRAFRSE